MKRNILRAAFVCVLSLFVSLTLMSLARGGVCLDRSGDRKQRRDVHVERQHRNIARGFVHRSDNNGFLFGVGSD